MKKPTQQKMLFLLVLSLWSACSTPLKITEQQAEPEVAEWPAAVTYEIFVQSFCDSDNDGIGDIKGMTSRLDYLRELGVGALWLMPVSPSPSYHKYDVTDYYGIHPDYGTMDDFKEFVKQAHQKNIKVVIDLVLNHSGSDHPWFKDAAANVNSPYRDYYVWAHEEDPQTKETGEIIAGDSDNVNRWHKVDGSDSLYYGYFYGGMPDLNYDNPALREEVFKIGRFWLEEVEVDGFRLDAARHIFPDDRPKDNHQWWVEFREEMQKVKKDVYLVGEVWADAETVAPYIEGLPALFNFDMGYAIADAVRRENVDSLLMKHEKIRSFYKGVNPDFIDAIFLTNHDQNRIMSEVNDNLGKAKMAAALLFTLPGSPYIFYGEEIGMKGVKPDEQIREPFLWDVKSRDGCRTSWMEPKYSTDKTVTPAAVQAGQENSLLNHYKKFIGLRNNSKALTYGSFEPISLENSAIAAFTRIHPDESLLLLHNLSASEVCISLPAKLEEYKVAMFGNNGAVLEESKLKLPPYSSIVLQKGGESLIKPGS